ncbi:MAG: beta-galactosidase [Ruminococcaceae bacterium]|nr:beta-galactosidase [Oscillospiraceae bacterium]
MGVLTLSGREFLMDGEPFRIISGAIHYFRVHPDYWADRLKKLKVCGFNTVETYICWNLHERKEGVFDFEGPLDVVKFIEIAEELGLNVIIRPGPYICAEWELGGIPSRLLADGVSLRCSDPLYLEKVMPYYKELFSRIRPHLCTNGGSIIMVQVENEYGSYGDDREYMKRVAEIYRENGIDCMLFTADGVYWGMQENGAVEGIFAAANFGSDPGWHFDVMDEKRPGEPLMCAEFWCGWFEHWHGEHKVPSKPEDIAKMVREFFDLGASFNFYMFHGGTNFGFMNGANYSEEEGQYQPTVTSYDYGAPLSEAGDMTETYFAVKEAIAEKTGVCPPDIKVEDTPKASYGKLVLTEQASLFDNLGNLSSTVKNATPLTMEQAGQDFGYMLYRTELKGPTGRLELEFSELRDRVQVFLDGSFVGMKERSFSDEKIFVEAGKDRKARLDILVENMGRINYGYRIFEEKGIVGGVRLNKLYHFGWEHYPLTMEDLSALEWKAAGDFDGPSFYRGKLEITGKPSDTFVKTTGFTKGFVTVNGFNLGRFYNSAGPTKTLFLPAPVLKEGENEIIVFETDGCSAPEIEFVSAPILG